MANVRMKILNRSSFDKKLRGQSKDITKNIIDNGYTGFKNADTVILSMENKKKPEKQTSVIKIDTINPPKDEPSIEENSNHKSLKNNKKVKLF